MTPPPESALTKPRPLPDLEVVSGQANGNGSAPLPMINGEVVDPERIAAEVEAMGAEQAIAWAIETFGPEARVRGFVSKDELGDR